MLKKYLFTIKNNKDGFSLIEIMVALAIASIFITIIYATQRSILSSVTRMTGVADFYEDVNMAIRRIDRDISTALYDRSNRKLFFIGENSHSDKNEGKIHFITINHNDYNIIGNLDIQITNSDVKEISYFIEPDQLTDGLYFLKRREANQYDDEYSKGGSSNVLLKNVVDVKFEFKNRKNWENNWDSKRHYRFPKMVKTTLIVKNYQNKEETFIFTSRLRLVK